MQWRDVPVRIGLAAMLTSSAAWGAPRQVDVSSGVRRAIHVLVVEARAAWDDRQDWPRTEADFAEHAELVLSPHEIFHALGEQLHDSRPIDGYVKWQLLSYANDLGDASETQFKSLLGALPDYVAPPRASVDRKPGRGGRAYIAIVRQQAFVADLEPVVGANSVAFKPVIGVVTTGVALDVEGAAEVRRTIARRVAGINREHERTLALVRKVNEPIRAYRDAIAAGIPERMPALRLAVMIEDLEARIVAGEPSFADVAERLLAEADRADRRGVLSPGQREKLVALFQEASQARFVRAEAFHADFTRREARILVDRTALGLGDETMRRAMAYLQGLRSASASP